VQSGLLEHLRASRATLAGLAAILQMPADAAQRLIDAAIALQLVQRRGSNGQEALYGLGAQGAMIVGNPAVLAMISHHALLYRDLQDPLALLRGQLPSTLLREYWAYARNGAPSGLAAEGTSDYTALMAGSQALVAGEILAAHDLGAYRCVLDVGGGNGQFLRSALTATPGLQAMLFDLPTVAHSSRAHFDAAGLSSRVQITGGDFFKDPLPSGADVVTLVRVLHDHDDEPALQLLRAIRRALPPGGLLLIAEPMGSDGVAERVADAYFGFYLLAMGQGRARSPAQISALLAAAGFGPTRELSTHVPLQTRVLLSAVNPH
jgi:demethylspheroidene O-methyltransferase